MTTIYTESEFDNFTPVKFFDMSIYNPITSSVKDNKS